MDCRYCKSRCIKKGRNGNVQKYQCKSCLKFQQENYKYISYTVSNARFVKYITDGCGIRSTGRLLEISPTTVIKRILKIASETKRPHGIVKGKSYEVDEIFTFVGNKNNRICACYSLEPKTGNVIDFVVGRRNKGNLKKVTETLVLSEAKKITTDKLNIYKQLIPKEMHSTKFRGINHIERKNLNLRTHLKRLSRKTICYSKSAVMLLAVLKIYFWH